MVVKIYVPHDPSGKELAPNYPMEVRSVEWMLTKAWRDFHHITNLYAIIANLIDPCADVVVFTERGIGILELKNVSGVITADVDGVWRADSVPIKSGIHLNPRVQAQHYATKLRKKLIPIILPPSLRKDPARWDEFKFQTAVCFTHPYAHFNEIQKKAIKHRIGPIQEWESAFSIIGPGDFTSWIRQLRFQAIEQREKSYEPIRLEDHTIANAITLILNCVEWTEMLAGMPQSEPYAYLILEDPADRQIFSINQDQITIGRNPNCDITIPERFIFVSKLHCRINRTVEGIEIEDLGSRNGTIVNGKCLTRSTLISNDDQIILGGHMGSEKHCTLIFKLRGESSIDLYIAPTTSQ